MLRKTIIGAAVALLLLVGVMFFLPLGTNSRTAQGSHPPVKLSEARAASISREIQSKRNQSQTWLRQAPTSYLAAVARKDFGTSGTLTIGSAADNDVVLEGAAGVEPHHLRVTVAGDNFRVEAVDSGASFSTQSQSRREATLGPSGLGVGRFTLWLSHQRFPALIVFDPQSPRLKEYKGLKHFPVDLAYRYELPLTPNPDPETVIIMSTRGHKRRARRVGWFDFLAGGNACRLEATRLLEPGVGEDDLIILFRDATTGKETYPLGRYVDAKKLPDGNYLLDFNTAYNPACAFSDYYNCPVPPPGNTLSVPIRAGEMDSRYH